MAPIPMLYTEVLIQVVEATREAGILTYKAHALDTAQHVSSIHGYVVLLPTMDAIHGQDPWHGLRVSDLFGDHSLWDVDTICADLLPYFFQLSGARPLPEIAEYAWRLDKVGPQQ